MATPSSTSRSSLNTFTMTAPLILTGWLAAAETPCQSRWMAGSANSTFWAKDPAGAAAGLASRGGGGSTPPSSERRRTGSVVRGAAAAATPRASMAADIACGAKAAAAVAGGVTSRQQQVGAGQRRATCGRGVAQHPLRRRARGGEVGAGQAGDASAGRQRFIDYLAPRQQWAASTPGTQSREAWSKAPPAGNTAAAGSGSSVGRTAAGGGGAGGRQRRPPAHATHPQRTWSTCGEQHSGHQEAGRRRSPPPPPPRLALHHPLAQRTANGHPARIAAPQPAKRPVAPHLDEGARGPPVRAPLG